MGAPLLVIGLDGATLDLVEPWARAGRLPNLARLMNDGAWGPLRSTLPPATFPAWTSLTTGLNPGRHGVLDFTERVPGTYRVRFVNGSRRRVPALWTRLSAAGRRVAVITVPATYPPEPVAGVMVSGWDTPLTTEIDGSFVYPRALHDDIRRLIGRLPFADFQEISTGAGWHARALASLMDGIRRRTTLVTNVLRRERWDACMVVYGESDTVAHHFWRFHDPTSPRHEASPHASAIRDVYTALDEAVGALCAAAPPDAAIAVVSDHGSGGAGDRAVYLNRRLAECGLLRFRRIGAGAARAARAWALRAVPLRAQAAVLRRAPGMAGRLEGQARLGNIDWSGTEAFSEELDYHPGVWLNLAGRDPEGIVAAARVDEVRARIARALADWRHDDGTPVVARVWRREEVYHGPYADGAPDLLLELADVAGYSPSCLRSDGPGPSIRRLAPAEFGAGKGSGMNGAHRRDGLCLLAGTGVARAGRIPHADITDVLPTLLALGGLPIPEGLDGAPIASALLGTAATAPDALAWSPPPPTLPTPAEAREMAARLAALGYLEPGS